MEFYIKILVLITPLKYLGNLTFRKLKQLCMNKPLIYEHNPQLIISLEKKSISSVFFNFLIYKSHMSYNQGDIFSSFISLVKSSQRLKFQHLGLKFRFCRGRCTTLLYETCIHTKLLLFFTFLN